MSLGVAAGVNNGARVKASDALFYVANKFDSGSQESPECKYPLRAAPPSRFPALRAPHDTKVQSHTWGRTFGHGAEFNNPVLDRLPEFAPTPRHARREPEEWVVRHSICVRSG